MNEQKTRRNTIMIPIGLALLALIVAAVITGARCYDLGRQHETIEKWEMVANVEDAISRHYDSALDVARRKSQAQEYQLMVAQRSLTSVADRLPEEAYITMECTAYTADECGKDPSDPGYGITASGEPVTEWLTVAAGPDYPFGTEVYIPYFKNYPNRGVFRIQDRGGAIANDHLDVYMKDSKTAAEFGRRDLKVLVLN